MLQDKDGNHLAGEIPAQAKLVPGWATLDVPETTEDDGRPERTRALVADLGQIEDLEAAVAHAFVWTVGPAALLGILGGLMLSRVYLRKVDAIGRTAEAIIAGDLSLRIPTRNTGDDLDRLAGTLNQMLDRIGALMDSLRQVSSAVAHDLRTPLSRLYHRLEGAGLRARSTADYERAVDAAVEEADGLLATFAALLRIAQVEGRTDTLPFAPVDLGDLVETVADAVRPDTEASGHHLDVEVPRPVIIVGDRELLTQGLANLVENAMRHTPPATRIIVSVHRSHDHVEVVVRMMAPAFPRLTFQG